MAAHLDAHVDLHALVHEGRSALQLPGVAVTVSDGQHFETHCAGHYDERSGRPIDSDTLFPLGCLAKVVTAVLALRLCDQRKLELDTPLVDCFEHQSPLRTRIRPTTTIAHVLSHTSAIHGPLDYRSFDSNEEETCVAAPVETTVRQSCEPGSIFSYSHTAYACLALALEAVARKPWLSMARGLFDEIGGRLTDEPRENTPPGHEWRGADRPARPVDPPRSTQPDICNAATGAAIYTDSASLASLGLALVTEHELRDARRLLSDRSIELLRHAAWRPKYGGSPYFGVGLKQFARGCYGHRGWTYGQHSFLLICPERHCVLAFCTNASNDVLARRLMLTLTGRDFDLGLWVSTESGTNPEPRACIGRFVLGDHCVDIASRGSRLTFCARPNHGSDATAPSAVTLFPAAPNFFVAPCPFTCLPGAFTSMMIQFIQGDEQSECRWLRVNDLVYERLAT